MSCFAFPAASSAAPPVDLPAAIFTDPVDDAAHPASGQGVQFRSHGALLLASRSVLLITASHDDDDDKAADFTAGMQRNGAAHFTTELMETDHGFNSRRIALQASVLRWLAALPGAPR